MMLDMRVLERGTLTFMSRFLGVVVVSAGLACSSSDPGAGGHGGTGGAFFADCASAYTAQVAKPVTCDTSVTNRREVTNGLCGSFRIWTSRDGYSIIECVYDARDALVGTRHCTDTGCMSAGQMVDLSACLDGGSLETDRCSAVDGGGGGAG